MSPSGWLRWWALGPCLSAAVVNCGAIQPAAIAAVDPSRMPPPPARPVEHHDPDQLTCQPNNLLNAWRQQLQPFADQPAQVLERMKAVQRDLAVASLNHCIERGLLSRSEARTLAAQMGLDPQPSSEQRP